MIIPISVSIYDLLLNDCISSKVGLYYFPSSAVRMIVVSTTSLVELRLKINLRPGQFKYIRRT